MVGSRSIVAVSLAALALAVILVVAPRPSAAEASRVEADVRILLGLADLDSMAREIVAAMRPRFDQSISAQMPKMPPRARAVFIEELSQHIAREMALIKVAGVGEKRVEALRIADAFRARVVDATTESFVFEMTGATDKLDAFVALMRPLGLVEVSRTGVVAIARGPKGIQN